MKSKTIHIGILIWKKQKKFIIAQQKTLKHININNINIKDVNISATNTRVNLEIKSNTPIEQNSEIKNIIEKLIKEGKSSQEITDIINKQNYKYERYLIMSKLRIKTIKI